MLLEKPSFKPFNSCLIKLSGLEVPSKNAESAKQIKPHVSLLWLNLILLVILVNAQNAIYLLVSCSYNYFCVVLHTSGNITYQTIPIKVPVMFALVKS